MYRETRSSPIGSLSIISAHVLTEQVCRSRSSIAAAQRAAQLGPRTNVVRFIEYRFSSRTLGRISTSSRTVTPKGQLDICFVYFVLCFRELDDELCAWSTAPPRSSHSRRLRTSNQQSLLSSLAQQRVRCGISRYLLLFCTTKGLSLTAARR